MSELLKIIFLFFAVFALLAIMTLIFIHLHQILKEPKIQKRMRTLRKPVQPWVTVLLYSYNSESLVGPSLKALLRSYYHNFDIVVINDFSNDSTKALKKGYSKSYKGEVVLSLRAGTIVSPSFLKRAVAIKGKREQLTVRVSELLYVNSLTAIIHSLSSLVWQRTYKVKISDNKNITAIKKPVRLDFLFALLFGAVVALSFIINEPIIVWYSWVIITGYLFAAIWLREEKVRTKLILAFSAISALFMLPVASVVIRFSQLSSRN